MKAISVREPWAWLIIRPDIAGPAERRAAISSGIIKDIENRTWPTRFRGRVLIHASQGMTRAEYEDAAAFCETLGIDVPPLERLPRGGIIGAVTITGCTSNSYSPWFFGPFGFELADPEPLPFRPVRGALGFFDVPG